MRSLLESILDNEDILIRSAKQHVNDEAQRRNIINGLLSDNINEQGRSLKH